MKLWYRAVDESLKRSAARRCADDAVEPVCLIFSNTWAEILKTWYYMQTVDPLCAFFALAM